MKDIPLSWSVTAIVVVVLLVGVLIWRRTSASAPVASGPRNLYEEYRGGQGGAPPGGPAGAPPGAPAGPR
jgi:hypothetical protein